MRIPPGGKEKAPGGDETPEDSFPGWAIAVICCGAAVIVGLVVFFVVRSRSKKNKTDHNKEQ